VDLGPAVLNVCPPSGSRLRVTLRAGLLPTVGGLEDGARGLQDDDEEADTPLTESDEIVSNRYHR